MPMAESINLFTSENSKDSAPQEVRVLVDGTVIATAKMHYYPKPFPLFEVTLSVGLEYQGRGYGKKALKFVQQYLEENNKAGILVDGIDPSSPAHGMYVRNGWQIIGPDNFLAFNLPKGTRPNDLKDFFEQGMYADN